MGALVPPGLPGLDARLAQAEALLELYELTAPTGPTTSPRQVEDEEVADLTVAAAAGSGSACSPRMSRILAASARNSAGQLARYATTSMSLMPARRPAA